MQFSIDFMRSIFFCLGITATLSKFVSESPLKHTKGLINLRRSHKVAFEQAVDEENNLDSRNFSPSSSGFQNLSLTAQRLIPSSSSSSSSSSSKGLNTDNQKLLALVEFILATTEGQHFYFLYDQLHQDIADQMTRLMQHEGDVAVFECDSDLVELEAVIRAYYHVGHMRNIFVLCSSQNTVNIFKQITSKTLESEDIHWFIILKENITTDIGKVIREGTQVSAAVDMGYKFKFLNSYINRNHEVAFSEAGWWQWHPSKGPSTTSIKGTFTSSLKQPLYRPLKEVYSDFGGRIMRSAVVANPPFFDVNILPNGTVLPLAGIDFQIINTLAAKLNFSYRLVLAEDSQWGALQADGKFSGMIGKVEKGLAHFAICEITITTVREVVADFTLPYFMESTTLVSPAPQEKSRAFAVFSPFTVEVWLVIVAATLMMGPIIAAATWFQNKYAHNSTELQSVSMISFTVFRSLVIQGNLLNVQFFYQRAIFMTWFLFCTLIYALYSGTLTAVLTVPSFEKPIDSLWDLLSAIQEDGYKPVLPTGSSMAFILKEATSGIYKQLWEFFSFPDHFVSGYGNGHRKVLSGKFVFITARLGATFRAKRVGGLQKFYIARNTFLPQSYGIACTSGSPYRRIFGSLLLQMISAGLINKWTIDELAKEPNNLVEETESSRAISLVHLQAAFYIVLIGYSVALGAFIMEHVSNQYHKGLKKEQNTN